jgi:alpha-amylase/alpha-mannosidase (GH57 family)
VTERYICIHGHFYQPPRENPWLETIEVQDSAYPFHDWNERITAECYGPNASARILDERGYITRIVSNYARMSFNFGPTLLSWLERARPDVYRSVIAADGLSRKRFAGHGSAMAQAYNHSILPLATRRDRITQIRWGIRDFEHRFARRPEGMWLPETAVDLETLELLAAEGIAFTVLAPHQAASVRLFGDKGFADVTGARIDPKRAYRAELPGGRSIALFFYDGPVSQAIAFERLLQSGDGFAARLQSAFDPHRGGPQLVHVATDGETYGHHHRYGDMALAYALHSLEASSNVRLTNYGEFLAKYPPDHEVRIAERTSWSCAHGIERWRSDCGCNTGGHPGWDQAWRGPLRDALDWLSARLGEIFVHHATPLLRDPWTARDAYVDIILDRGADAIARLLQRHALGELDAAGRTRVLELLEMQRHALLMYTSCGWFFDEVSGIETIQIIRYAARAIQLAEQLGEEPAIPAGAPSLRATFLEKLSAAHSNVPEHGDASHVARKAVDIVDLDKLAAHYAVSSLFHIYEERAELFAYFVDQLDMHSFTLGRAKLVLGTIRITSQITLETVVRSFGFVHFGDHNLSGGVRAFENDRDYEAMCREVSNAFERADMPEVLRLLDSHFLELTYSLRSLFRDEQRTALDGIVRAALSDAEALAGQLYETHSPLLRYLATLDLALPKPMRGLADFVLNTALRRELERNELDYPRLRALLGEAEDVGTELDRVGIGFALREAIERATNLWTEEPEQLARLRRLRRAAEFARMMSLELDLYHVQNRFYALMETVYPRFHEQAERGDPMAIEWREHFRALGEALRMRVRGT